jgi:CRISPR/Cas system endoribonuclease Cas6 (RAMP superfamily)
LSKEAIKTTIKHNFASSIQQAIQQTNINVAEVLDEFDQIQPFDLDIVVVQALTEIFEAAA